MAAITADSIGQSIAPFLNQAMVIGWYIAQLLLVLAGIFIVVNTFRFNVKVIIREITKGGRTIVHIEKALETIDKKSDTPQLQFFGVMGFGGRKINQPPSECVTSYKGTFVKKIYDFVKKDGIYFPTSNIVLGKAFKVPEENQEDLDKLRTELQQKYDMGLQRKDIVYSVEGSGIEISRDYDAEQAIQNNLIAKAETYRNQKPSVLYAMYGLAIILAIGSFIAMVYSWKQFGNMAVAIESLKEPLKQGVANALSQKLGP